MISNKGQVSRDSAFVAFGAYSESQPLRKERFLPCLSFFSQFLKNYSITNADRDLKSEPEAARVSYTSTGNLLSALSWLSRKIPKSAFMLL